MNKESKIYIAGHRGLVGSAILNNLKSKGYTNFITRTRKELDLTNQRAVEEFFKTEKPDYVFLAAAKVGGIIANNTYRADFIYENLMIQNNVIYQAYFHKVKKLLFLGSTCIYPKNARQPMKEEYMLTDTLEYTNEPYAIAKIAGIKMCESYNLQYGTNFIAVQPTNLYGPHDNFDLERSHVLPALIRKIHLGKALENNDWKTVRKDLNKLPIEGINGTNSEDEILEILSKYGIVPPQPSSKGARAPVSPVGKDAKGRGGIEIWGSGNPMREFLWSEDMADACVYLMERINANDIFSLSGGDAKGRGGIHINIGTGKEISIKELAETIKLIIGFTGELYFNTEKPDGTMRKLTDSSKLHKLGWKHKVQLEDGIKKMYNWYLQQDE